MNDRLLFVLGAPDPEMQAIESLLRETGIPVAFAVGPDGRRVHPGNAYRATGYRLPEEPEGTSRHGELWRAATHLVECAPIGASWHAGQLCLDVLAPEYRERCEEMARETDDEVHGGYATFTVIDHHRPGDPGFGKSPAEFLPASSIGQVISVLARLGRLPTSWTRSGGACEDMAGIIWCDAAPSWWIGEAVATTAPISDPCTWVIPPQDLLLTAAADHCLAAAYRGECPGVDPDRLMRWRAGSRAEFQGRKWTCQKCGEVRADSPHNLSTADCGSPGGQGPCGDAHIWVSPEQQILADVETTRKVLRDAPQIVLADVSDAAHTDDHDWSRSVCDGCRDYPITAADMRGPKVPELPEASAREGICFVADGLPDPDGRIKVVCQSGSPGQIRAFMEVWAPAHGLVDVYGDPARGFAGGYLV